MDEQDDDLWHKVTRGIQRLSPSRAAMPRPDRVEKAEKTTSQQRPAPPVSPPPIIQQKEIDSATLRRIKNGKIPIEAVCDLHGMSRHQAARRVKEFISRSVTSGHRLVLVITGKGSGALKKELPHWLEDPVLQPHILKTLPAPKNKGGDGATLIYLRRQR